MRTQRDLSVGVSGEGGISFKISEGRPSQETVSAMLEAERIAKDSSIKGYTDRCR